MNNYNLFSPKLLYLLNLSTIICTTVTLIFLTISIKNNYRSCSALQLAVSTLIVAATVSPNQVANDRNKSKPSQ